MQSGWADAAFGARYRDDDLRMVSMAIHPDGAPADAGERAGPLPAPEGPRPGGHRLVPLATALMDATGRILHWSADAELVLGYPPEQAVGNFAARLLVTEAERPAAQAVFNEILAGHDWSGTFPVLHRNGQHVHLELRTHLIMGPDGAPLVLATASDARVLHRVEADLAVVDGYFTQSPIGMAVFDTDLRLVRLNSALAKVTGLSPEEDLGRRLSEVMEGSGGVEAEAVMRHVLTTGEPVLDARSRGAATSAPERDYAWSASYFRLQDASGRVLGVSSSIIDVTERFKAEELVARARERLALLAEATAGIGTTLDLRQTARELAEAMVPHVADGCEVLVLDRLLGGAGAAPGTVHGAQFVRRLAVAPDAEAEAAAAGTAAAAAAKAAAAAATAAAAVVAAVAAAQAAADVNSGPAAGGAIESGAGGGSAVGGSAVGGAAVDGSAVGGGAVGGAAVGNGAGGGAAGDTVRGAAERNGSASAASGRSSADTGLSSSTDTGPKPGSDRPWRLPPDSAAARAMATGRPVMGSGAQQVRTVPLIARGTVLGAVVYSRGTARESFDDQDITFGDELIVRAAVSIDNARLYLREHETVMARQAALQEANEARERLALINDASTHIGTTLDLQRTAEELVEVVLPRFADFATVDLLETVMRGEEPGPLATEKPVQLRAVASGEAYASGLVGVSDSVGDTSAFDSAKTYAQSLRTGRSILIPHVDEAELARIVTAPDRVAPGMAAGIHSYMMVPLVARGVVLGGSEFVRMRNPEPFDETDLALAEELVARAAVCVDNARLYRRERATALTLQRSLLPQEVHHTLGMEIAYRYLPTSVSNEVGGDWFDVVPLSSGRVALVVGDVMGHGIRAAATMGQLRTVARTLATLDMDPEQVLSRLDETASGIGDGQFATCVCAVYDPVDHSCAVACAGHLPPVVVSPDGTTRLVDLPPGVPLGVGGVAFESVEFTLPEHSILALYTDGLVERRGRDIDEGIDLLRRTLGTPNRTPEQLCDAALSALVTGGADDDIAVIVAQALPIAPDRIATLPLTGGLNLAGDARRFTRRTLESWDLGPLTEYAELLVSELVTNALVHAVAPRQLRLFRDRTLTVEVADSDAHTPKLRRQAEDDEGGRGMYLVNELAHRWGTHGTRTGKTVWFELELPLGAGLA